jgi:hypothetical protein
MSICVCVCVCVCVCSIGLGVLDFSSQNWNSMLKGEWGKPVLNLDFLLGGWVGGCVGGWMSGWHVLCVCHRLYLGEISPRPCSPPTHYLGPHVVSWCGVVCVHLRVCRPGGERSDAAGLGQVLGEAAEHASQGRPPHCTSDNDTTLPMCAHTWGQNLHRPMLSYHLRVCRHVCAGGGVCVVEQAVRGAQQRGGGAYTHARTRELRGT